MVLIQSNTDCCMLRSGTTLANKHAAREAKAATPRGHGLGVHFADEARVAVSGFFKNYLRARDAAVSRAPGRHVARVGDGAPHRPKLPLRTARGERTCGAQVSSKLLATRKFA
jgi:hypothetical protein